MFVIRAEQLATLGEVHREQFVQEMVNHWRTNFRQRVGGASDAELRARVVQGMQRGESYGVLTRYDLRRYLEYVITYGDDFDGNPRTAWAGSILAADGLSGTEKMDQIDAHETFVQRGARPWQ